MEPVQIRLPDSRTRENLFTAKYAWLLRWALHFAQGDRPTAEDLVQDAFIRFVLAETKLRSAENIEALLYTYLKYAHLAHLRRLQRYPHEPLSIAEFDSLQLGLRESQGADQIDVQDTLRRIVAYACWRKESAKSASVLILRFFHGCYHDEIMGIARMTRKSVDTSLWEAREEVGLYLSDPGRLRIMHQAQPPEVIPKHVAFPSEQVIQELRRTILAARRTECWSSDLLLEQYRTEPSKPIEREMLAHIVSCASCLHLVTKFCNIAPPSGRSPEESAGPDRRSRRGSKKDGRISGNTVKRALQIARERAREVYEHRPRRLTVAVNGAIIASQGVTSPWTRQEIVLSGGTKPEFIEVMSEQGVCLLAMRIGSEPPDTPPEIRRETELSLGRRIEARLQFTSLGPLVEITYHDPSQVAETEPEPESEMVNDEARVEPQGSDFERFDSGEAPPSAPSSSLWSRVRARIAKIPADINPVFVATTLGALIILLLGLFWSRSIPKPTANGFLAHAIASQAKGAGVAAPGVVQQKVKIRTPKRTIERSIYRDAQGLRHRKAEKLTAKDMQLKTRLARANVSWDEPLSPLNYKEWRDGQRVTEDVVRRSGDNLLTLTSDVGDGEVERETLTVRARDFHPVERTVTFRNAETIEVAELDYSVSPWGPPNESLFDPLPRRGFSAPARVLVPPPVPLPVTTSVALPVLTKAELDEAELKTRLVLNQLHADTDERIHLSRDPTGIQVSGIVETGERKQELEAQLSAISYVTPSISTFQEMQTSQEEQPRSEPRPTVDTIQEFRQPSEPSLLEMYLKQKGWSLEKINDLSWQLLESSIAVSAEGKPIADLVSRFGNGDSLSPPARSAFDRLMANRQATLLSALQKEDELLDGAGVPRKSTGATTSASGSSLGDIAAQNRILCEELAKGDLNVEQSRSAEAKIVELRVAIDQTRTAAQHLTTPALNATTSTTTSSNSRP